MDVVCVGILVADVIARPVEELPPRGRLALVDDVSLRAGGCAVNTASALVRFGLRAAVAGKVGTDVLGDFLLAVLEARGVGDAGIARDPVVPTSATVVLVDQAGERTFLHLPGANGRLRAEDLDEDALFAGRALHVAGALVMPELDGAPMAALLAEGRRRGLLTSLDPVWDPTARWEHLRPSLPHLDLLAPSLAEGEAISGVRGPEEVAAWLRGQGTGTVALKMGADGCYASGPDFEGLVEPVSVAAVDGTGSGDAFVAGLLYGRLSGWPLERAARLANAAGALATTVVGAVEGLKGIEETAELAGLGSAEA
jgi:sugar/nucleoside kinase (ribokinase family)